MDKDSRLKITYVSPDLLKNNPWNSNTMSLENEAKLMASIERNDFYDSIVARLLPDNSLEIIGGEHRVKVAKKMGIKEIPVTILKDISDNRAKEICLSHNSRYGEDDSLKLSELLNSLDDPEIMSSILPLSDLEIETFMSASKIDMDSLEMLLDDSELDEIPLDEAPTPQKTHTIMRFKVSIEDAAAIQELIKETIKTNGFKDSDALTNAGDALVHVLLH